MTEACVEVENYSDSEEDDVDCMSNDSRGDDEDFHEKLSDKFLLKKRRCNFRSLIKSSDISTRAWNIDKTRQKLLERLMLLPIGKHSFEVLAKFIINHQILEIVKVLKVGSCVDLQAKVNLDSPNFSKLGSENVIIKIYQQKTTLKADSARAQKFEGFVCSKERNPLPNPVPRYFYHFNYDIEALTILKVGNIVFSKMIGDYKPAPNLIQMIKSNPKKKLAYLENLLELIKRNRGFWDSPSSSKNILWHQNQWMIVCLTEKCSEKRKTFNIASNIYATLKIFLHFGVPCDVMLAKINECFPQNFHRRYDNWLIDIISKINEKLISEYLK